MGMCGSIQTDEDRFSRRLDKKSAKDDAGQRRIHKLLLLGAGESGKSTLFKQLNHIYGDGYTKDQRMQFADTILCNTISSMRTLVREALSRGVTEFGGQECDCTLDVSLDDSVKFFVDIELDTYFTEVVVYHIKRLWASRGIQNVYKLSASYQLPDAVEYLFGRLDDFVDVDFCPTYADILRGRVRSTGIVESSFSIRNNTFLILDVGGQR